MGHAFSLIDTHAHLDALAPLLPLTQELQAARRAGVPTWVVPGVAAESWPALATLVASLPGAFLAPGLHPAHAAQWTPALASRLAALCAQPTTVAVGEIGLDATVGCPLPVQEHAFRAQLRLAREAGLPVLVHCRRATGPLLRILSEEGAATHGGILHAFSGSLESARDALRLNFALACGGPLTWPEARRAPHVAATVPHDWLVLESDAPDLAPHPYRGQINRPSWLPLAAARLAALRSWSLEECATITSANARRILSRLPRTPPLSLEE